MHNSKCDLDYIGQKELAKPHFQIHNIYFRKRITNSRDSRNVNLFSFWKYLFPMLAAEWLHLAQYFSTLHLS